MQDIDTNQMRQIALEFDAALKKESEEEIHKVMAANDDVFFPDLHTISKYKLADEYITDFISIRPESDYMNDPRAMVQLVEIERADYPLFTNGGDPSSRLTHAIRQVQDWKFWIRDNRDYFQRQISKQLRKFQLEKHEHNNSRHGVSEHYIVIIGRRYAMTIEDRMRLAQMNDDLDGIAVMTYDMLLDRIVDATREHGSYGWRSYWFD